jgi:hypothetical protein
MALELTFQTNYELKVWLVYFGKPALSIVAHPVELHRSWLLRHFSRLSWTNKVRAILSSQSHFSHTDRSRVESLLRSSISISRIPISDIPHSIRENESHHIKDRPLTTYCVRAAFIQLHLTWLAHVLVSSLSTFCSNVLDNLTRRLSKAIVASESLQR